MPIEEFGSNDEFSTKPSLPHQLEHKPIYAIPYEKFDGIYAGDTDARYLSVGTSQWSDEDVSLKIMRHTGEKWTRQAEELPLHRVIDSAIFIAKVLFDEDSNTVEIEKNLFKGQTSGIKIQKEETSTAQQKYYDNFMSTNGDLLKDRFKSLFLMLDSLNKKGKL